MKTTASKKLLSLVTLSIYLSLAWSSTSPPVQRVTISQIITGVRIVVELLKLAKAYSKDTSDSVNVAYRDLSTYLNAANLSSSTIQLMEQTHASLQEKSGKLRGTLSQTKAKVDDLFALLKRRADENQTPALKEQMLADINQKETEFNNTLNTATQVLDKLDGSIKKYDDILGYCQVKGGLMALNTYIGDINQVINEANKLNQEAQVAINQGLGIMNSIQEIKDEPAIEKEESSNRAATPQSSREKPQSASVGHPLIFHNACSRPVQLVIRYASDGRQYTVEGLWATNPNQKITLADEKKTTLLLHNPTLFFYAWVPGADYSWQGDYPFSFEGQSLPMRQQTLTLDSQGNYVLQVNCPNLPN